MGSYLVDCNAVCSRQWGFRLVLLWSYWTLLFLLLALKASVNEIRKRDEWKERQRLMHVVDEDVDLRPYFIRDTILEENYAVGDGVSLDGN